MRGIGLTHALADVSGLAFDRIFMITEPDGTFITARQFPQMVRFTPSPVHDGLHLTAPDGSSAYVRFADFAIQDAPTEVWGTHFTARIAPDAINKWLSGFFSREVQLRWVGATNDAARETPQHCTPCHLLMAILTFLLTKLPYVTSNNVVRTSVKMEQFRPNLVVSGASAREEDSWKVIRIGDVVFDVVKPCSRCIFTTVSPEKGQKTSGRRTIKNIAIFPHCPG